MTNSNLIETFSDVESEVRDVPKIILWFRHLQAKIPRVGRHFIVFVIIYIILSIMTIILIMFNCTLMAILDFFSQPMWWAPAVLC